MTINKIEYNINNIDEFFENECTSSNISSNISPNISSSYISIGIIGLIGIILIYFQKIKKPEIIII
jgi:hypothetical protein